MMKIDFRFLKTFFLFCAIDSGNINCTVLFNLDFLCVLPEGRYQNEKTGKRGNFDKTGVGGLPNPTSMFLLGFFYRWECYKMTKSDKKMENSHVMGGWVLGYAPTWKKSHVFPYFFVLIASLSSGGGCLAGVFSTSIYRNLHLCGDNHRTAAT